MTSEARPGSNDLAYAEDPTADDFEALVETYGRAEASRRWMAMFAAVDSSAVT